jgi:hypothetical protein
LLGGFWLRGFGWSGWLVDGGLAYREVFAHFVEAFAAQAFDGEEVIDAFEGAVGFAHLQDFLGGCGADAGDLLEFFGIGGVDVDGLEGRLLGGGGQRNGYQGNRENETTSD